MHTYAVSDSSGGSVSVGSWGSIPNEVIFLIFMTVMALGYPKWLACLPLDPRFTGSNPAEDDGF
jgi:hypothetical protein